MTVPGTGVSNQWTDFEDLNATILHNRIDAPLIALGSGNSFVRTRTTSLGALSASTDLAIAAWPTSLYATGSFGSYSGSGGTAGQFTFTLAGLYMWVLPVTWPNSGTYKAQAKLLINGVASPDGDNIAPSRSPPPGRPTTPSRIWGFGRRRSGTCGRWLSPPRAPCRRAW
jgi:hypothetical protein